MSRELFRGDLPVVVHALPPLAPDGTAKAPSLSAAAPTSLLASLTLSPAAVLSFTIADLRERLFHCSFELSEQSYPRVRDAQALRVDYAAFPHRFADLLRKPAEDPCFVAILELPPDHVSSSAPPESGGTAAAEDETQDHAFLYHPKQPRFTIAERNNFRNLPHIELRLQISSELVVRRAIADYGKRFEVRAAEADAADRELVSLRNQMSDLQNTLAERDVRLAEINDSLSDMSATRAHNAELQDMVVSRERELANLRTQVAEHANCAPAQAASSTALEEAIAERDSIRAELTACEERGDDARARLREAAAEIQKGNRIIARMEAEARAARRRARIAAAVVERQEEAVGKLDARVVDLAHDARQARERAKAAEAERDGMRARLATVQEREERTSALRSTDQQVIAFLNRELSKRVTITPRRAQARSAALNAGPSRSTRREGSLPERGGLGQDPETPRGAAQDTSAGAAGAAALHTQDASLELHEESPSGYDSTSSSQGTRMRGYGLRGLERSSLTSSSDHRDPLVPSTSVAVEQAIPQAPVSSSLRPPPTTS